MPYPEQVDQNDLLRLGVGELDGVLEIALSGEIDLSSAGPLERRLGRIAQDSAGDLVVRMADVSFIDSSGLRVVLVLHKALEKQGRRLVLGDVSGAVRRVIEVNLGEGVLHVHDG